MTDTSRTLTSRSFVRRNAAWFAFIVTIAAMFVGLVGWVQSRSLADKIERAGGTLIVDRSGRPGQSGFQQLPESIVLRLSGRMDDTAHVVRLAPGNIDDAWLKAHRDQLERLCRGTILVIHGSAITAEGISHLRDIKNIHTLNLRKTPLDGSCLEHIATMPDLQNLNIAHTGISDEALAALIPAIRLAAITIDGSQATDVGIGHLAECPWLYGVNLIDPSDETLARLTQLPQLMAISLTRATLSPEDVAVFQLLPKLQSLSLFECRLEDGFREEFRTALPACRIDLISDQQMELLKQAGLD